MQNEDGNKLMQELALALIYLIAWKESGDDSYRAWKGYNFNILDQLKEQALVDFSYKAKSLYLSEEGEEKAKQLVDKFKQIT